MCLCIAESLGRLGFPGGSAGKESTCNAGDMGLIPGLGRSPGEGKGYSFQYSGLENSTDCIVHGITKSQTRLSYFRFYLAVQLKLPTLLIGCTPVQKTRFKKIKSMSNSSISIYGWVHYLSLQVGTYKRLACSSDLNMKNIAAI